MNLRPYQIQAITGARAVLGGLAPHRRRSVLLVAPTGSGKTVIGAEIVRSAVTRDKRALWAVHRTELVDQAYDKLVSLGLGVGVLAASSSKPRIAAAPVQVASLDTLIARDLRPPADLVVFDEAHHAAAAGYAEWLAGYPLATVVGLTATPERSDGSGLGGKLFSALLVVTTPRELETQGHLVPMEIIRPASLLKAGMIAQRPVDAWRQHAAGRPTIVFCASVEHAQIVAREFTDPKIALAGVVTASTPWRSRLETLDFFKRGVLPVLCNVAVLTEGTDLPLTSCIILARGCGTAGLYLQMAGRGARPSPGKRDCVLIDLRGVSHTHGHPYDDRQYSLDGRGIAGAKDVADQSYCRVCGAPIEAGTGCAECGVGARDRSITVTGAALVRYAHVAAFRDDQKARMLATLLRKSKSPKQAYAIYAKMSGAWPDRETRELAEVLT